MAKLTYVLRKGKSKSASIQLFFNYGTNKRLRYSTGLQILDAKNWDDEKFRIKNVTAEVYKNEVNNRLNEIRGFVEKLHTGLLTSGENIDNDILKNELDTFLNKSKPTDEVKSEKMELLPFFKWYIKYYQKASLPTTRKPMNKNTTKTLKNSLNIFQKFNDTILTLKYNSINNDFYTLFIKYMN